VQDIFAPATGKELLFVFSFTKPIHLKAGDIGSANCNFHKVWNARSRGQYTSHLRFRRLMAMISNHLSNAEGKLVRKIGVAKILRVLYILCGLSQQNAVQREDSRKSYMSKGAGYAASRLTSPAPTSIAKTNFAPVTSVCVLQSCSPRSDCGTLQGSFDHPLPAFLVVSSFSVLF